MPSISSGFWVASTKNGGSSLWRSRATETWCSCIASSSADWVLGVARLISSASTRLANTGPGWNRNVRWPPSLDEDVGADDVGGHQVGRELDAVERAVDDVGEGPHEHRLAQAGHALEQRVAVGDEADQHLSDEVVLAHDDLPISVAMARARSANASDDSSATVGSECLVVSASLASCRLHVGSSERSSRARSP